MVDIDKLTGLLKKYKKSIDNNDLASVIKAYIANYSVLDNSKVEHAFELLDYFRDNNIYASKYLDGWYAVGIQSEDRNGYYYLYSDSPLETADFGDGYSVGEWLSDISCDDIVSAFWFDKSDAEELANMVETTANDAFEEPEITVLSVSNVLKTMGY